MPAGRGPRCCRVRRRSPATRWWRRWTRSGSTAPILVSPFSLYRYDASYALEVRARHPGRFAWSSRSIRATPRSPRRSPTGRTPGTVGIRIMMARGLCDPADPGINRVLAAAARHALPVNLLSWGRVEQARELAARNPNTQMVDRPPRAAAAASSRHLPRSPSPTCRRCWRWPTAPTSRSRSAAPARCRNEPFPYQDIWDPLRPHLRCLRAGPLHVGHRLDPRGGVADLRARGRGVPRHRPSLGQRPRDPDGRNLAEGLRLGAFETITGCRRRGKLGTRGKARRPTISGRSVGVVPRGDSQSPSNCSLSRRVPGVFVQWERFGGLGNDFTSASPASVDAEWTGVSPGPYSLSNSGLTLTSMSLLRLKSVTVRPPSTNSAQAIALSPADSSGIPHKHCGIDWKSLGAAPTTVRSAA